MAKLEEKTVNLNLTLDDLATIRFVIQPIIETYQDMLTDEVEEEPNDPMTTFDIEIGRENLSVDKEGYESMKALYKKLDNIIDQHINL